MNLNNIQINGPNNVVRLEDGKNVLYIFGDIHNSKEFQTECNFDTNKDIIDIDKFLFKFITTEKKKKFDIFIEFDTRLFELNKFIYKFIYFNQVKKMLSYFINFKDNKITINNKYPNFKFHYMDIRNFLEYDDKYLEQEIHIEYYYSEIELILKKLEYNLIILQEYKLYLLSNTNKYIDKILNKYNNKDIKKKINFLFNKIFIINLDILINKYGIFIKYIKTITKNNFKKNSLFLSYKINKNIKKLDKDFLELNSFLTDLYFLRRFLDKDYINNSILYTGLSHLVNIMCILVKYFNFTVTHIYWTTNNFNLKNIKKIKIKKLKHYKMATSEFIHYNEKNDVIQCINLTNFPINFI